jgi:3-oxoacyl-[acyl-carrier-protein] synthase-3
MGTVIKATGVSTDPGVASSITHAALAAKACLAAAGVTAEQIDVLINVGVYRDKNMVEPSMAALIQKELGIGPDVVKYPNHKPAFSFDLMNGACGLLSAVHAGAALLTGGVEYVLIVSSDTHPSNQRVPGFPYASLGGAMLLAQSDGATAGFSRVHFLDSDDNQVLGMGIAGAEGRSSDDRNRITVQREPEFRARLLDLTVEAVRACASRDGIELAKTLLVTSQPTPDFGTDVARRLGLGDQQVIRVVEVDGDPHTSALTLGYHGATARGELGSFEQVMFVAAGAGLTTACAVYRR